MSGENGSKSQIDLDLTLCCANLIYQADKNCNIDFSLA